jgi:hypothetical protein
MTEKTRDTLAKIEDATTCTEPSRKIYTWLVKTWLKIKQEGFYKLSHLLATSLLLLLTRKIIIFHLSFVFSFTLNSFGKYHSNHTVTEQQWKMSTVTCNKLFQRFPRGARPLWSQPNIRNHTSFITTDIIIDNKLPLFHLTLNTIRNYEITNRFVSEVQSNILVITTGFSDIICARYPAPCDHIVKSPVDNS